ncbi:hypothetical protein [Streptomyces sp. YIM S03343]
MNGPITLGGASVMAALLDATGLARYCATHPRKTRGGGGRHRAPAPVAVPEPERNSVEALVIEITQCPNCRRDTQHVRFRVLKSLMCLDCRRREA